MKSNIQDKTKLVNSVFSKVYKRYDLMNDILSLGLHRVWKERFIQWMSPQQNTKLIDVASGTGDIAKLFSQKTNNNSEIICLEPNMEMLEEGRVKLKNFNNVRWINASAERLPFDSDMFDYYSISYGIRNVNDISKTLRDAFRVLKTGGRFMCLEFSKVDNEILDLFYQKYSKTIPYIGKFIVGSEKPYKYLVKSIESFISQKELVKLMRENGFSNIEFRNLSNGISAIHSGWKI